MAKPIFIIRVPSMMSPTEIDRIRDGINKDDITDDYHILVVPVNGDDYKFEMFNADKIERQEWNTLVNKIIK